MLKICFVRGKYLNNFEGQNYLFKNLDFTALSSLKPIHKKFPFKVISLPSPADIPGKFVKYLANRLLGDSQLLIGLEKLAGNFDLFHSADPHYYYSFQLAKLRSKQLIKKLIITSWETIPFNNETVTKKRGNKYFVLNNADKFICHTEKARQALLSEGVSPKKISVIKLGVNLDRFRPKKTIFQRSLKDGTKKAIEVLFVGRLVEEKGLMDLYKVFKGLKNIKIKLRIIGKGELRNKISKFIKNDRLEKQISVEEKNYQAMPDIYNRADILVLPSKKTTTWEEQYGMVLIEAMASGLPVVAYNTGAIGEILGDSGILINENDTGSLLKAILRLAESSNLRKKIGRMGRDRAKRYFDAKDTAAKIQKIYENIRSNID